MGYGAFIDIPLQLLGPVFSILFDPVFGPLLNVGSASTGAWLVISAVALGFSLFITALHFLLVDRERHEELQNRQKELKERQSEKDPEEMDVKENMGEMKDLMFEQMRMTMRVNVASMLVVILLFPWLYTTFSPIVDVSGDASGELVFNGKSMPITVEQRNGSAVIISGGQEYAVGESLELDGLAFKLKNVDTEAGEVRFETVLWNSPIGLPFTGKDVGWLGTYILLVIPFSILVRKIAGLQ